jgi:hypothetical protein
LTRHFVVQHGAVVDHYAILESCYRRGVRRYGFHGLSYQYIAGRLCEIAPSIAKGRVQDGYSSAEASWLSGITETSRTWRDVMQEAYQSRDDNKDDQQLRCCSVSS